MLLLLGVLGVLSLVLSGFLVVNTISALLAQQVRQIGIMKAIGARSGQIVGHVPGDGAGLRPAVAVVAVPLGVLGALAFTGFMAGLFNFDLTSFDVPAAGPRPAGRGRPARARAGGALSRSSPARASPLREAMSDYGLGKGQFGRGLIDRLLRARPRRCRARCCSRCATRSGARAGWR